MLPVTDLPELPASLRWLHTPPLQPRQALAGHVVAVLFWRLGCVHSRAALQDLGALQAEHRGAPFAGLAVHVPTTAAERDEARVARWLERLPVPVLAAVDPARDAAAACAVAALPTLLLAGPRGEVVFHGRGEPDPARLGAAVGELLAAARAAGTDARLPWAPVAAPAPPPRPLAVAAAGERLFVAVAGQPGVLAGAAEGGPWARCGAGAAADAAPAAVRPQAAALLPFGTRLLLADEGAHQLVAIDRASGSSALVAGTGRRAVDRRGGGYGDQQPLPLPAGLAAADGAVYASLAGQHQLWQVDPATGYAAAWLGSGRRGTADGPEPEFAEPRGLLALDGELWLADAGSGAVRCIDLGHQRVRTAATGLVRPVALAAYGDELLVADSWQPAVWRLPRGGGAPRPWLGAADGLVEPTGLAVAGDTLWLADAGAAALFAVDLRAAAPALRRVPLPDLPPLPPPAGLAQLAAPAELQEFSDVQLRVPLPLGPGELLDPGQPCAVDVLDAGAPVLAAARHTAAALVDGAAELWLPIGDRGGGALRVRVEATVRHGAAAAPRRRVWQWLWPVEVSGRGALQATLAAAP